MTKLGVFLPIELQHTLFRSFGSFALFLFVFRSFLIETYNFQYDTRLGISPPIYINSHVHSFEAKALRLFHGHGQLLGKLVVCPVRREINAAASYLQK
jgi:hypothetical protein